jgi:uncharacterized protein YbaA (DUF1428 family)
MAGYVDGFLFAVPKDNVEAYRKLAQMAGEVYKEFGALEYVECVGDDIPDGKVTDFPMSVKATSDEVVGFAWITYESKEARDEINKKVMADPRMDMNTEDMPLDMSRMIFGGFKTIVEL